MTSIKSRLSALKDKIKRREIKPLADRNRVTVGVVGMSIIVALVVAVFSYEKIPFLTGKSGYSAYFTEAGGIKPDSDVRVSGLSVGRVSNVKLDGTKVLVSFTVDDDVALGNRTEASIKTETVLGTKMLEITPRGDGKLQGPIPVERTRAPYDLPDALGDLTSTISALRACSVVRWRSANCVLACQTRSADWSKSTLEVTPASSRTLAML